jgi:DNA-directed RNA polymerase I and III subunit RPAC2
VFHNEDHTLGNLLLWALNKDPDTELAGYSIPHPSEPVMNLRLQTHGRDT